MRHALEALFETPQNNLRLFVVSQSNQDKDLSDIINIGCDK